MTSSSNPLISSHQASDVQVILHPLVLLTISDYITRHTLREQPGPIMGAILGQHNGREITIEHAFECHTVATPDAPMGYSVDRQRFLGRLEQFKTVHKDRMLDLVGWYTLIAKTGPTPDILPTHTTILELNDSSLLLGFHPDELAHASAGAKLPLTIYESNYEADDDSRAEDDEDKKMQDSDPPLKLKFRELQYTVEAGAAEMISMDFVARGGGNATAVEQKERRQATQTEVTEDNRDSKRRIVSIPDTDATPDFVLTREEEEMISALTAKANAIKMLQARIQVIHKYLDQLPESFKAGDHSSPEMTDVDAHSAAPSYTILRQIQALVSRLEVLVPSNEKAFQDELLREKNDVNIISILNGIVQGAQAAREVGRKFQVIESNKPRNRLAEFANESRFAFNLTDSHELL
ncbi:hypothetical protein jhhlp_003415 [Lomentospora prolificans]|uniref:COP9 signalosome complex subunit 6 n=1 Tax=Lomentospora prolificans TaxID=41688 RepID=A0A2N3N8N3_9PEZI|nr:hypothetical protein jhhlp_003415 [Lomentospora prolificans]